MMTATNTWDRDSIHTLLNNSDKAVTRAVIAIYNRQTAVEQSAEQTREQNGVGFNHADANYLTYCAKYCIEQRRQLSGRHLERARKAIKKYWKQLAEIANNQTTQSRVTDVPKTTYDDNKWGEFA